jgi:hypothetical protein
LLDAMSADSEASKEAIVRRMVEDGVRYGVRRVGPLTGIVRYLPAEPVHTGDGPPPDPLDAILRSVDDERSVRGRRRAPPSPLDAIVGSVDHDPVDDIDEVIYGR